MAYEVNEVHEEVSEIHQKQLEEKKRLVENFHLYFKSNYDRFNRCRSFVFDTTLDDNDKNAIQARKFPVLEFNICRAYISRLLGEFSKYVPDIVVGSHDGMELDPNIVRFYEGHLRYILHQANNNGFESNIYMDTLSGGFSDTKIWTDYVSEKSFEQEIKLARAFDPCLCGHDPLARLSHKGDGEYCFEIYPKTKGDFEKEYPGINIDKLDYTKNIKGFSWSYATKDEKIILICDFYQKKRKKEKLVRLADGQTLTKKEYKEFLENWSKSENSIQQPPAIIEERTTEIPKIVRYRFIETKMLEYTETFYTELPIVFTEGASVTLQSPNGGNREQMMLPYIYHALDTQRLKNFAGQALANELENMVQHKFMIAKEAIPLEYTSAYTQPQIPNVVVYNAFNNNDPQQPLPQPREINRVPCPPEVMQTFMGCDQVMQSILGSYDPQIGNLNESQLSGIAIIESASMGNSAAMPYVIGYLQGLNQTAKAIVGLIPKIYLTHRSLPVLTKEGKKEHVTINHPSGQGLQLKDNKDIEKVNVKIEAGIAFGIQKSRALQQITALMQASQLFGQFMNTEGLPILLDNMEIRGIDQLKEMAGQWLQQMKQQQAMAQQQAQQDAQNNPMAQRNQIEVAKLQQQAQESQMDMQLKSAELALEKERLDNDRLKLMLENSAEKEAHAVQIVKAQTEQQVHAIDATLKISQHHHEQAKDIAEHHLKTIDTHLRHSKE